jgi:hypothetical protein
MVLSSVTQTMSNRINRSALKAPMDSTGSYSTLSLWKGVKHEVLTGMVGLEHTRLIDVTSCSLTSGKIDFRKKMRACLFEYF